MKAKLKYEGPIKGRIRCLFKRKRIGERYEYMLNYLADRICSGDTLEDAIDRINWDCADDDTGMYLFTTEADETILVAFGFRDMQMKDTGYYELAG